MKSLQLSDLNRVLVKRHGTVRAQALLDFANLANAMYGNSTVHPYLIGDCVLGKMNMLRKGKRARRVKRTELSLTANISALQRELVALTNR